MDMILNHLEQMFTNALLQPHDITALIRDTEIHERALFTAAVAESGNTRKSMAPGASASENALSGLKPGTAVGRILGSDLQRRIRRSERSKGEVDVNLLLEGAEKLCAAYPMPGVLERIHAMRTRHEKLASSIALHEERLAEQAAEFAILSSQQRTGFEEEEHEQAAGLVSASGVKPEPVALTLEDEEAELQQLEEKRKDLEERVTGLERDLGGMRG